MLGGQVHAGGARLVSGLRLEVPPGWETAARVAPAG